MTRPHLDEGSRNAIAFAVAETLNTASSAVLAQYDLAPTVLAKHLLEHPIGTQHFNDTERSLYQRIVSESCEYIVDIASQLPSFTERTFAEILKREGQILSIARQTLEELRHMREQSNPLAGAAQFELEYRRAVVRKLDVLELFGVDVATASRRHRLSVAYVTLLVEQRALPHAPSQKDEVSRNIVSVEAALSKSHRMLFHGINGSGKTCAGYLRHLPKKGGINLFSTLLNRLI